MRTVIYIIIFLVAAAALYYLFSTQNKTGSATNSVVIHEAAEREMTDQLDPLTVENDELSLPDTTKEIVDSKNISEPTAVARELKGNTIESSRSVSEAESIRLPLSGSAPAVMVRHSIPLEEIRQGCFRQDCIPSVDNPEFVSVDEANTILPDDTIGIGLDYKGELRFYPFNMLVTREIVNDTVAGDALLITYCPLCGTGIVFDRTVDGVTHEFGVSGMLWQSNLLMYNRAADIEDRNLWSQVLGEAVVGKKTGTKLSIVPSNIVKYTDWRREHGDGKVLNTGSIGDPYNGNYYGVAQNFTPDFDDATSPLDPTAYVFGIEIGQSFKAYPRDTLPTGTTVDLVGGQTLTLNKTAVGEVTITNAERTVLPVVSGFWFSWVAAHPSTELWSKQ